MAKTRFACEEGVTRVVLGVAGSDRPLKLEQGKGYETDDPNEIAALDAHPMVRRDTGRPAKAAEAKEG